MMVTRLHRVFALEFDPALQVVTVGYDFAGRPTAVTATSADTTLASRTYAYTVNATGNADQAVLHTMTDQVGNSTTYTYDGMNRLASAALTHAGTTTTAGWSYDKDGNRITAAKTGAATVNTVYNGADQQCWSGPSIGACGSPPAGATRYTYDNAGNQTTDVGQTNTFTVFNQLATTASTTDTYAYPDTTNTERASIDTTTFVTGVLGQTAETTSTGTVAYIRDPFGTLIAQRAGTTSYYLTTDIQGSVIAATNPATLAAAFTYDPWGTTTSSTGPHAAAIKYRYATGYYDTTAGLDKLGARYYNPTTGHFTQPDPTNQESNAYAYTADNPTNNTDPTGYNWFPDAASAVGVALSRGWNDGVNGGVATGATGAVVGGAAGLPGGPLGVISGATTGFVNGFALGFVGGFLFGVTAYAIGYNGPDQGY